MLNQRSDQRAFRPPDNSYLQPDLRALERLVSAAGWCVGQEPENWFPLLEEDEDLTAALCAPCEVRAECLELALRIPAGAYGVWGGTMPHQRRRMGIQRAGRDVAA